MVCYSRRELFDSCTAKDKYFAPEDKENKRSIQEVQKELEDANVLHEDREEQSTPSFSVSNPPLHHC